MLATGLNTAPIYIIEKKQHKKREKNIETPRTGKSKISKSAS